MKKVLFITGNILPCYAGDAIYSYGNLIRISELCEVDILTYYNEDFDDSKDYSFLLKKINKLFKIKITNKLSIKDKLGKFNIQWYQNDFINELLSILNTNKYDCIIIDHLRMAFSYKFIKKSNLNNKSKIILIEHNVEYQNIEEEILFRNNLLSKIKLKIKNFTLKKYEKSMIMKIKNIWFISEEDKIKILDNIKHSKNIRCSVITPNFPYKRVKEKDSLQRKSYNLIITGSMGWYPNVDGVIWFCKNVFKKLIEEYPEYKLYIVGNKPGDKIKNLASNSIIVTGKVKSTDEYLKNSDFLIVPNKIGSGVKIKILEAIKKGVPVISIKESTDGYNSDIFSGGFCVYNKYDFINSIVNLNNNAEKKVKFIDKAIKIIESEDRITIEKIKRDLTS